MKRKVLAIALSLALACSFVPTTAFATQAEGESQQSEVAMEATEDTTTKEVMPDSESVKEENADETEKKTSDETTEEKASEEETKAEETTREATAKTIEVGEGKTLAEAVKEAVDGDVIVLTKDSEGNGIFLGAADAKSITIDLNGYSYTFTGNAVGSTGYETQGFHLEKGNTVTIKNGTVACTENSGVKMLIQNYSNLTITDVTVDGRNLYDKTFCYVVSNNCGNVLINGSTSIIAKVGDIAINSCKFQSYEPPMVTIDTTGSFNGPIELSGGKLKVVNGTFTEIKTVNGAYSEGDAVVIGGKFNEETPVAKEMVPAWAVGGEGFNSLNAAVAAAKDGDTIKLMKSGLFDQYNSVVINKKISIDLNGNNITSFMPSNGHYLIVTNGGDLNLFGGTVYGAGASGILKVVGNVTTGGEAKPAKATLTGTTFAPYEGQKLDFAVLVYGNGAELVVNDGTVINSTGNAISGNGTVNDSVDNGHTKITINGGNIHGNDIAIYQPQSGDLTINGGTLTGDKFSAVEVRAGNAVINGGTLVCTATEYAVNAEGSGATTHGAALAVAQHTTKLPINVTVNGGIFKGVKAVSVTDPQETGSSKVIVDLGNNATYEGEVVNTLRSGVTQADENGVYVVSDEATFKNLMENADNATIRLAGEELNFACEEEIEVTHKLTLDLGKTSLYIFKETGYPISVINGGDLTITSDDHTITSDDGKSTTSKVPVGKIIGYSENGAPIKVVGNLTPGGAPSSAKLTLKSGWIVNNGGYGVVVRGNGAELIVDYCRIYADEAAISGNGTCNSKADHGNTKIKINDGEFEAETAIYHPQSGYLEINDGIVRGLNTAIEMRAGTAVINGGSIWISCANGLEVKPNGNGPTVKGAVLAVSQHTTKQPISVTVKGEAILESGLLSGRRAENYAVYQTKCQNGKSEDVKISLEGSSYFGKIAAEEPETLSISGGYFISDGNTAKNYLKPGFGLKLVDTLVDETFVLDLYQVVSVSPAPAPSAGGSSSSSGEEITVTVPVQQQIAALTANRPARTIAPAETPLAAEAEEAVEPVVEEAVEEVVEEVAEAEEKAIEDEAVALGAESEGMNIVLPIVIAAVAVLLIACFILMNKGLLFNKNKK